MTAENLKKYIVKQQISIQWGPVLSAMAAEMSEVSEKSDLRDFFFRIGERFASKEKNKFKNVETLSELENSLNSYWTSINWGWVELEEKDGTIDITHNCSPIAEAFGNSELSWTVGLLEGFYQTLFFEFGANDEMKINCIGESADGLDLHLKFSSS